MSEARETEIPGGATPDPAPRTKKAWCTPAIVEQDLLETVAGACGPSAKTPGVLTCTDQSLT